MKYPDTIIYREAWLWLKPEMEDMVIDIAKNHAGWRDPNAAERKKSDNEAAA